MRWIVALADAEIEAGIEAVMDDVRLLSTLRAAAALTADATTMTPIGPKPRRGGFLVDADELDVVGDPQLSDHLRGLTDEREQVIAAAERRRHLIHDAAGRTDDKVLDLLREQRDLATRRRARGGGFVESAPDRGIVRAAGKRSREHEERLAPLEPRERARDSGRELRPLAQESLEAHAQRRQVGARGQ